MRAINTAIIVPCYNEAERLDITAFQQFITKHPDYMLCFVNDGSTDNTLDVLEQIKSAEPTQVKVIDLVVNCGKAQAVRAGAMAIHSETQIPNIGFIDADLSTDFEDFKRLVFSLTFHDNLEMVYGSRNSGQESNIERNPLRKLFSNVVKAIIYFILGLPIDDTQCGAKVFSREIIPTAFGTQFLTKWLFDVEIFIRMKRHYGKNRIMDHLFEQPLQRWVHVDDSKLGVKDAVKIPYMLFSIWFSYNVSRQVI